MPLRLNIPLRGQPPAHSFQHTTGLRALVLKWLDAADAGLAEDLHDRRDVKPYAISPIWNEDGALSFDISLLDDALLEAVVVGMGSCSPIIRLGSQQFHVSEPQVFASATWEDLLAGPPGDSSVMDLQMITPTAHHARSSSCRKSVVLPSPELYFGSWLSRWNQFAPEPLPETILDTVADRVAVGACSGSTQAIKLDASRVFIGFEGAVRFSILRHRDLPLEELTMLWALARLAQFCGTGVETMRGMGQTRLING